MMNKTQWLNLLDEKWIEIRELIAKYHPVYKDELANYKPVTANRAEKQCEIYRKEIEEQYLFTERPDILGFKNKGDADSLLRILNETWIGIPESIYEVRLIGAVWNDFCELCEGFGDE